MRTRICALVLGAILTLSSNTTLYARPVVIDEPMSPPTWALMQRELLRANVAACKEFFERYFDERGYLICIERWGGNDGPDDAIEHLIYWPILHATGASDEILHMYKKAWEGHLRQYTEAKTIDVPFARDGMYYKEFPVMFDWLHHAEGLTVFGMQGLSDPHDEQLNKRSRRFAGFYMNEDPQAPNYDPKHKIIRSLLNGSRGPMLRKATALDWAGDPIEIEGRFDAQHGEKNYKQFLEHFEEYNDVVGDHPSNLLATCLALNAYMLGHEPKYKDWLLEYVTAWHDRMVTNGDLIPSNIGLDGTIGGETDGKWYGGVYGWAFTVVVPQTGALESRQTFGRGIHGFTNAVLLTGNLSLLDPWRRQMDKVNSNSKVVDGQTLYPHKYGDDGWYEFKPYRFGPGIQHVYYMTMREDDYERVSGDPFFAYINGDNPNYPEEVLRNDFEYIRNRVAKMRADTTTPDTRLSDDAISYNPAAVRAFAHLMMGGLYPGRNGIMFHCRLRYFDPEKRRAGIPEDVAALVESMSDDEVVVTLVNVSPLHSRTVVLQAGGYAEHQFLSVQSGDKHFQVADSKFAVTIAPGSGSRLTIKMQRYVNQPTYTPPWNRH